MSGHMVRDCLRRGTCINTRPTGSTVAPSSSVTFLSQDVQLVGRANGTKGAASFSGIQDRTYALAGQQNMEAHPDVATSI